MARRPAKMKSQPKLRVDPRHAGVEIDGHLLPQGRQGVRHGWHSQDAVEIPTSLTCNVCPLYHVRRKDRRHPLACPEAKKNQVCPILLELQQQWVEGLVCEVRETTGDGPTPSDNARIEQIIRHRSRIFQVENFLKVAGLIDLAKGEIRNVADRLTTTENALSRTLSEFRQAMESRRGQRDALAPRLEDYLQQVRIGGDHDRTVSAEDDRDDDRDVADHSDEAKVTRHETRADDPRGHRRPEHPR